MLLRRFWMGGFFLRHVILPIWSLRKMLKSVAGRPVPFMPRQFPIRLSRRIGLRTIGSLGAKKVVACPSGEQIVNGGFETGDFTGWEYNPWVIVANYYPHSGTYHAVLEYTPPGGWIKQTFTPAIPIECIASLSFWMMNCLGSSYNCTTKVTLYYDDDTENSTEFSVKGEYELLNLLPFLISGKKLSYVKFEAAVTTEAAPYIDDVSLIGTG